MNYGEKSQLGLGTQNNYLSIYCNHLSIVIIIDWACKNR